MNLFSVAQISFLTLFTIGSGSRTSQISAETKNGQCVPDWSASPLEMTAWRETCLGRLEVVLRPRCDRAAQDNDNAARPATVMADCAIQGYQNWRLVEQKSRFTAWRSPRRHWLLFGLLVGSRAQIGIVGEWWEMAFIDHCHWLRQEEHNGPNESISILALFASLSLAPFRRAFLCFAVLSCLFLGLSFLFASVSVSSDLLAVSKQSHETADPNVDRPETEL